MQRGDVVLVDFPFSSGTGSKLRPALVIQHDPNNQRLSNTIVAMITGTTHRTQEPTQLLIDITTPQGQQSGLRLTSAVTCENIFTVEQRLIARTIGRLPPDVMQQVDDCLKVSLKLS